MADPERSAIGRAIPSGSDWLCKPGNFLTLDPERGETHVERPPGDSELARDERDVPVVRLEDLNERPSGDLGSVNDLLARVFLFRNAQGCGERHDEFDELISTQLRSGLAHADPVRRTGLLLHVLS